MSLHMHIAFGDDQEEVRKGSETTKANGTATCIASRPKHPIPISSHE